MKKGLAVVAACLFSIFAGSGGAFATEPQKEPAEVKTMKPVTSVVPLSTFTMPPVELKEPPPAALNQQTPIPKSVEPELRCPPGFQFEESTGKCWALPSCPDGGTFDVAIKKCVKNAVVKCSEGFLYDPKLDKCTAPPVRSGATKPAWAAGAQGTDAGGPAK